MANTRRCLTLMVVLAVSGSFSTHAGEPPLAERLGSRALAEREQAMQGLSKELSRLERQGDRIGLESLLSELRRAAEGGDLETRSRVGELLAPFSAGGLLWRCADLPGIVNGIGGGPGRLGIAVNGKPSRAGWLDAGTGKIDWIGQPLTWGMGASDFADGKVFAGGYLQTDPDKLKGWMTALDSAGNVAWTRAADEMPGVRFLKLLPEGILAGGAAAIYQGKKEANGRSMEGYDPEGWVGLFDPATGKPLWIKKPGELAANNVSILPVAGGVFVAGLDTKGKSAWLSRYDLNKGDLSWTFRELPAKATGIDPAGPGRVCIRQAAGWVGLLETGYDSAKLPRLAWGARVEGSVHATAAGTSAVFVAGNGHGRGFLSAHDIATGKEVWKAENFPGNAWEVCTGHGIVCVAGGDRGRGWISVHDAEGGKLLWSTTTSQPVQHLRILADRLLTAGGHEVACWRISGLSEVRR